MKSRLTIKNKLFITCAAILVCAYAILFFASIVTIQNFIADQTEKDLEYSLKFAKDQFNNRQEVILEALKLPAASLSVQQSIKTADYDELRRSARLWTKSLDFLEMLTIIDSNSNVMARSNEDKEPVSFLQKDLFDNFYKRKQPALATELLSYDEYCREVSSDVCQSLPEKREVMVQLVFVPIIDTEGAVIGAIVGGGNVNKAQHLPFQQQKVFGKTVEMIVTQKGALIASTFKDTEGLTANLEARALQPLKSGFTFQGTTALNGRQYEMIAEPILNLKGEFIGSIAVALGVDRFRSLKNDNYRNLIICGSFSGMLIFALAYFTSLQVTTPIRRFSEAVKAIEAGDYSIKVVESGSHEFQSLTETFNRMTESLSERDSVIIRQNSELQTLNQELEKRALESDGQLDAKTAVNKAIINSLTDGLIVADVEQIIIEINPAAEKLFGIKASGLIGEPFAKLYVQPGLSGLEELIKSRCRDDSSNNETVLSIKHNKRSLRLTVTDLRFEKESGRGFLFGIRDVTVDGEVDRLKSGFIAKVSHELKTPLTSMKGSLQFILKKGKWLTGVEREMLTVCFRNTERLISLVSGIIELSRIEAGQISFSMKSVHIGEVVLYAIEEIKGAALTRNISIINDVSMDLPKVYGDYDRLTQVLSNLLSNAVKFPPENSVVTLSASIEKTFLTISVADNGKSIPEVDRGALFSRFHQMGCSEDGEFCGSGLGLAISREIIERHGGSIFYASGAGGGNVFAFRIPLNGAFDGKEQDTYSG